MLKYSTSKYNINIPNSVQIFSTLSKYSQLCPNIPNSVQIFPTLSKYSQLCPNIPNSVQIFPTVPNLLTKMLNNKPRAFFTS